MQDDKLAKLEAVLGEMTAVSDHGQGMATWRMSGYFCGNFRAPWLQYRKMIPGEAVFQEVAK